MVTSGPRQSQRAQGTPSWVTFAIVLAAFTLAPNALGIELGPSSSPTLSAGPDAPLCDPQSSEWCRALYEKELSVQGGDEEPGLVVGNAPESGIWPGVERVAKHPATWAGLALLGIAIGLYHRLHGRGVLAHPLRASILGRVASKPGVLAAEIATAEGVTLNAILHHVRILEREGFLRVQRVGKAGLLFAAATPPRQREALAVLRAPLAESLLSAARGAPHVRVYDAAERFQVTERAVRAQVARLARHGLVERLAGPMRGAFRITPVGALLVAPSAEPTPVPTLEASQAASVQA